VTPRYNGGSGIQSESEGEYYISRAYDVSELADGKYIVHAAAYTASDKTASADKEFTVDLNAPDVTGLTVAPNESNNALVLSWVNPEDHVRAQIFKWYAYSGEYYAASESVYEYDNELHGSPDGSDGYWDGLNFSDTDTYTDTDVSLTRLTTIMW
jgi:hypothetical protein